MVEPDVLLIRAAWHIVNSFYNTEEINQVHDYTSEHERRAKPALIILGIFALLALIGCDSHGRHYGMGGVTYQGPTEVCLHKLETDAERPYWGASGNEAPGSTRNATDCLLNLMVPRNWDCWLGRDHNNDLRMVDVHGNLVMTLPKPLCREITASPTGESLPIPMSLNTMIPARVYGSHDQVIPSPVTSAVPGTGALGSNTGSQTAPPR